MENIDFWEFELTCDISKAPCIEYIKTKLKNLIKSQKGIITTIYSKSNITLLIGLNKAQKMEIKQFLYSCIAEMIVNEYKAEYLRSNFDFEMKEGLLLKCFIKGLVCFDSDFEKQIIYSKLIAFDKINLESFVDFRLKFLKSKWEDLVCLANDNYLYLLSGGNFFELMKFLISNLDCRVDKLEVELSGDSFNLISSGKNLDLPFMINNKSQEDLAASIVSLCPKTITIYNGKNLNFDVENFLYKLFENRLQIVK